MCGRITYRGCDSAIFPTHGLQYSHMCGQILGYQYGHTDEFNSGYTIDSYYVDGVSITHGAPGSRQHVWTFAAGYGNGSCRCSQSILPFVGQDYFCETGNDNSINPSGRWFINDTLWDGQDCANACECTLNSPPWFCKQLPQATTDDIEVRMCSNVSPGSENTPVKIMELYIR